MGSGVLFVFFIAVPVIFLAFTVFFFTVAIVFFTVAIVFFAMLVVFTVFLFLVAFGGFFLLRQAVGHDFDFFASSYQAQLGRTNRVLAVAELGQLQRFAESL